MTEEAAPGLDDRLGRRLDSPDPANFIHQSEIDRVPAEVRLSESLHAARREARWDRVDPAGSAARTRAARPRTLRAAASPGDRARSPSKLG
jgi:hypothetical protein